ncbi:MAG: elongation factor P [Nitrospinota bacterium]|nr:MAG: elongation factor P [Nitrospinota bacterium]
MITATQIRRGMIIILDEELYQVLDFQHVTPGKGRGMMQTKLRSLRTGNSLDYRFRSDEKVERATLDQQEMEYLYSDQGHHYFMNSQTYEQIALTEEVLGDALQYLVPNTRIIVNFYQGTPVSVELPGTVDLRVIETEPGLKGATASRSTKPATLETGLVVQVPIFIEENDIVRIDTSDNSYLERVEKG